MTFHSVTYRADSHAVGWHKKWKMFFCMNSGNQAWWNGEVNVGYLSVDHLPGKAMLFP